MENSTLLMRTGSVLFTCLLLTACASTPPKDSVAQAQQQLSQTHAGADLLSPPLELGNKTLNLPTAIQSLLSRSPQVRIQLAQLGVADAQRLQAELISNPHLSIEALKPEDGGRWQLDFGLSQPLLELFTRPLRRELAEENLLAVQLRLQAQLQELIAQTGNIYYDAVAAQQHLQVQQTMLDATRARQQLANSLYRAGNLSENNFLFYDNELRRVQQQVNKREHKAQEAYLTLLNLIGLNSQQVIHLPTQLPILPTEKFTHSELLTQAQNDRLDIKIATQQLNQLENRRELLRKENGWRDMSVGISAEREFDGTTNVGPEIEFALPIFNRNQGKLAALDAQTTKAEAQLTQAKLDADTEIAQTLNQMQTAREQLELIQSSLQVAEKRVQLSNREINFMLGSPFELLNIKRQEIQLAHEYTRELASYWQARTELELALGRALPTPPQSNPETIDHNKMDHSKMDHSKMNHGDMDQSHMNHDSMNHSEHSESVDHSAHQHHSDDSDRNASAHEEHQHD